MSAKRSRLGRASSSGDTTVLSAPIFESKEVRWPLSCPPLSLAIGSSFPRRKTSPQKDRPAIFTLSSPVLDPVGDKSVEKMEFGNFLEKCCYCRNKIAEDDEVFMYSMRAFCTVDCREKQIHMDKDLERLSATPKPRLGKRAGGL